MPASRPVCRFGSEVNASLEVLPAGTFHSSERREKCEAECFALTVMSARRDVSVARTLLDAVSVTRTTESDDGDAHAHAPSASVVLEAADRETINIGCA